MMNDLHVFDSLPAYVLGSLEQDEARRVADHLMECYECRVELESFQQVTDMLPAMVPQDKPSAEVRHRLMKQVRAEKKKRAVSSGFRLPPRLVALGGFVGLLLLAILTASNILLLQRLNAQKTLSGPLGMRAVALENAAGAPNASGFVIISADGMNGVLVVDELPMLDAEREEYQLWLEKDGELTASNLFSVDEDGYRGMRLEAPDSLLTYSSVYITVEPLGGSEQPTGTQVLGGSLFNP